jgi:hypothetical protein
MIHRPRRTQQQLWKSEIKVNKSSITSTKTHIEYYLPVLEVIDPEQGVSSLLKYLMFVEDSLHIGGRCGCRLSQMQNGVVPKWTGYADGGRSAMRPRVQKNNRRIRVNQDKPATATLFYLRGRLCALHLAHEGGTSRIREHSKGREKQGRAKAGR